MSRPRAEGRAGGRRARVTTERKRAANRVNARLSTGPRSTAGKARVKQNALRHGLNVAVANDPLLTEEVKRLARAICDGAPRSAAGAQPAELAYLARAVAEAQVDLMRVRHARHAMMARALDNPRYRSPRHHKRQIAMVAAVGELLIRGIAVPDDMRKAAFGRPQGALKFALVVTDLATQLARFDRYERRALSRRKAAVAAFDAACAGRGAPVLIELPAMVSPPPDRDARRWRNKATAGAASAPVGGILRSARRIPSPSRNRVYAGFGHSIDERSKSATADFDCGGGRSGAVPSAIALPDQEVRCWRNKATAAAPSAPAGTVRAWSDRPTVSYREAALYVCETLDIDRPLRLDLPRDGPPSAGRNKRKRLSKNQLGH